MPILKSECSYEQELMSSTHGRLNALQKRQAYVHVEGAPSLL